MEWSCEVRQVDKKNPGSNGCIAHEPAPCYVRRLMALYLTAPSLRLCKAARMLHRCLSLHAARRSLAGGCYTLFSHLLASLQAPLASASREQSTWPEQSMATVAMREQVRACHVYVRCGAVSAPAVLRFQQPAWL